MVVALVWLLAVVMAVVILFQAGRSVWRSGRRCLAAVGQLGDTAAAAGRRWSELLDTGSIAVHEPSPGAKSTRTVRNRGQAYSE